jgi:GPH family glycoside/pentoside/hexuronide:cation symporter
MPAAAEIAAEPDSATRTGGGLPLATLAWYGLPGAGVTFAYTLILVAFMKFATDVLYASAAAVGAVMLVSKAWDAVSDPLAGYLSDGTRSRLGRRKPWMLGSALPLAVFFAMLWMPPAGLEGGALIAWISVAIFGFYTAYTGFEVPHLSLGAELTDDARERNRIYGARQLLKSVGLVLAFGVGVKMLDTPDARAHAGPLAIAAGAITALSLWASVRALPPERQEYAGRGARNPLRAVRDVWGNRLARIVLLVYFIESLGMGGIGVLTLYVIEYVIEMPGNAHWFLLLYTGATITAIPVWVRLGRRFEKRRLWMFSMGQGFVGFGMLVFLEPGAWWIMAASSLLAGTAGACGPTIGTSLKADVIDVDEYRTGERKEGAYFAAWSFVHKLSAGVMLGVVGLVLDAVGFVPNEVQTVEVRRWMLFLMGGMPMIGYGIGMWIFRSFDLSRDEHARIRAEIDARALARAREQRSEP